MEILVEDVLSALPADVVAATGRRVVVVHVVPKKAQKTPHGIETAPRRAREVT